VADDATPAEEVLLGGTANRGRVVRVGDTVRRPRTATSHAVHALLRHLERAGFPGATRLLGIDDRGREVLGFLEGEVAVRPYPEWVLTDEAMTGVAVLLRSYHDAVEGFDARGYHWALRPVSGFGPPLVSHNDANLDNVVFRSGRAHALIDFDLAGVGSRVWDVAITARLWAPLLAEDDVRDGRAGHGLQRFRLFVDAYGLGRADRELVAEAVLLSHDAVYGMIRASAIQGHAAFAEYWTGGGGEKAERTRRWYRANSARLRAAMR
jgi:hypothetical protein